MTDPATHYHRIETAELLPASETGARVRPDSEYLLFRLRGQLERLNALTQPNDPVHMEEIRRAIKAAREFGEQLNETLGGRHYDVV